MILLITCFSQAQKTESEKHANKNTSSRKKTVNYDAYKEDIKQAEELLFAKKRIEAINLLIKSLARESQNKKANLEIKNHLKEINHFFLSEKSQQNYELAINLKKADPNQALAKLNEALFWEPENHKLLSEVAKIKILKRDCQSQVTPLEKAIEINPWDEILALTLAQVYFCLGEQAKEEKLRERYKEFSVKANLLYWQELEVFFNLKKNNISAAKEGLDKIKTIDSKYPQIELIEYFIDLTEKSKNTNLRTLVTKKKFSCEELSLAILRKYNSNPFFCEYDLLKELM
ncbi:MAG: hypothetical protein L6Q37_11335 [Bdellovibrionaceae bacterium]|nr:hypothetical protein [Pseudobdellovibrionaceae bacterium]NUM60446.1 hypothetical protein [Pseudobdellovibrionaceae bacterium]